MHKHRVLCNGGYRVESDADAGALFQPHRPSLRPHRRCARLREVGFATAQLPVLTALKDGARLSQAELARWARVEQPTMAQLLARMERDGIIRREPDPGDRRSSLVVLTDEARAKLPACRAILEDGNREAMRGLSDEEVATLIRPAAPCAGQRRGDGGKGGVIAPGLVPVVAEARTASSASGDRS